MVQLDRPKFEVEDGRRTRQCHSTCSKTISQLIDEAVAMGWRREEIALQIADAADDYILYLASNAKHDELTGEENANLPLENDVMQVPQ